MKPIHPASSDPTNLSGDSERTTEQSAPDLIGVFDVADEIHRLCRAGIGLPPENVSTSKENLNATVLPTASVLDRNKALIPSNSLLGQGDAASKSTPNRGAEFGRGPSVDLPPNSATPQSSPLGGSASATAANGTASAAEPAKHPIGNVNVLARDFLRSIATEISARIANRCAVVVVSNSGRIADSGQCGWSPNEFRSHLPLVKHIAREAIWTGHVLRTSQSLIRELVSDGQNRAAENNPAKDLNVVDAVNDEADNGVCCSVTLGKLGTALRSPDLQAVSISLPESGGFLIAITGLSTETQPTQSTQPEAIVKGWLESVSAQVDTWFMIKRCQVFAKWFAAIDWFRSKPRWWLAPIGITIGTLLVPLPYLPRRECVFEPEFKQFLSSPIQGRIAICEVRPGAVVTKGQLLARIDEDQLVRDLATANADLSNANKKKDAALASRLANNYSQAALEAQQAQLRVASIQDQLQRLEVRSPVDGVVVLGDWQRSIGMPVTLGQNLFEVAELETMTAEVHLTATDLGNIHVGDEVSIRADSSGGTTFTGKISRIEPRAKVIDDEAIFSADVTIEDSKRQLRPGMKGTAQIDAGWKSIGWLLFSRPYRWLANQWVW